MTTRQLDRSALEQLQTGEVVGVRISGVWHEGLIERSEQGEPWVWNKSKRTGRVERERFEEFAPSSLRVVRIGYLGELPPSEVIERARARQGEQWTPIENCQRFTRQCHGVRRSAPDVDRVALALFIAMCGGPL